MISLQWINDDQENSFQKFLKFQMKRSVTEEEDEKCVQVRNKDTIECTRTLIFKTQRKKIAVSTHVRQFIDGNQPEFGEIVSKRNKRKHQTYPKAVEKTFSSTISPFITNSIRQANLSFFFFGHLCQKKTE